MSRVVALDRRLRHVERRAGVTPYDHLTDTELEARVADLKTGIEAHGVRFPRGWDRMDWTQRASWLQQEMEAA